MTKNYENFKRWCHKYPEKRAAQQKRWRANLGPEHRKEINEKGRLHYHAKYAKDPEFIKRRNTNSMNKSTERRAWLQAMKAASGCSACGEKDPICLDFHHRDRNEKSFRIGSCLTLPKSKLVAEINKCDILCANCHRKRHRDEKTLGRKKREVKPDMSILPCQFMSDTPQRLALVGGRRVSAYGRGSDDLSNRVR